MMLRRRQMAMNQVWHAPNRQPWCLVCEELKLQYISAAAKRPESKPHSNRMKFILFPVVIATELLLASSAFVECDTAGTLRHKMGPGITKEIAMGVRSEWPFRNGLWSDWFLDGPRIPGSHYFDMSDISTSKDIFPTLNPKGLNVMFPPKSLFAATMDAMGITNDDQVAVYGRRGCWFTPRIWYMFKTYGQSKVGLMQGSLEDWIDLGGPVDSTPMKEYNVRAKDLVRQADDADYLASETARNRLVDMDQVLAQVNSSRVIVDTRGSSYKKKGHIPGAIHIPYSSLVEPDNSLRLKNKKELVEILEANSIPRDEHILLTCGSGVSSTVNHVEFPEVTRSNLAELAQSVERTTLNRVVVGSIPTFGAINAYSHRHVVRVMSNDVRSRD
eukprot:scaffold1262_cov106-Cylindrotheca_fusiformis.AAC.9